MNDFEENLKDAIVCNDIEFLEKYREQQYDINYRFEDEHNDTLLLYAISDKGSEAYKFFLENGADTTLVNDRGEGTLHAIVHSGIPERLSEFMKNHTFDINARNNNGTTPLHLSTLREKFEMAKILIAAGADVNIGSNEGYTPLHDATWVGNLEIVKSLMEHGANQHIKPYPLTFAINEGHKDVVKYLFPRFYSTEVI